MVDQQGERAARLYLRALEIREQNRPGLWVPIIWHLALRRHTDAMIDLASWFLEAERWPGKLGSLADSFASGGLYTRAFKLGNPRAAQHLAMHCFNRRDLRGYRHWLKRGAAIGDGYAANQSRHFETRLPHSNARRIRRLRPHHDRDDTY